MRLMHNTSSATATVAAATAIDRLSDYIQFLQQLLLLCTTNTARRQAATVTFVSVHLTNSAASVHFTQAFIDDSANTVTCRLQNNSTSYAFSVDNDRPDNCWVARQQSVHLWSLLGNCILYSFQLLQQLLAPWWCHALTLGISSTAASWPWTRIN